jgi:hypothetical protein
MSGPFTSNALDGFGFAQFNVMEQHNPAAGLLRYSTATAPQGPVKFVFKSPAAVQVLQVAAEPAE